MAELALIPRSEFDRVRLADVPRDDRLALLADMCPCNTLSAVKLAGSGHLGSSFSAMDIVISLYLAGDECTAQVGWDPDRDVYFSSKGHDVPGLYAVLHSLGVDPRRRGCCGCAASVGSTGIPTLACPGIEANSGSLGMGISKGRGMAWAKRFPAAVAASFVMTGDGELQEGQNYEALQSTVHQGIGEPHRHRRSQQGAVRQASRRRSWGFGDLEAKFRCIRVVRHARATVTHLGAAGGVVGRAAQRETGQRRSSRDTIKGSGVSFMEHPRCARATAAAITGGMRARPAMTRSLAAHTPS